MTRPTQQRRTRDDVEQKIHFGDKDGLSIFPEDTKVPLSDLEERIKQEIEKQEAEFAGIWQLQGVGKVTLSQSVLVKTALTVDEIITQDPNTLFTGQITNLAVNDWKVILQMFPPRRVVVDLPFKKSLNLKNVPLNAINFDLRPVTNQLVQAQGVLVKALNRRTYRDLITNSEINIIPFLSSVSQVSVYPSYPIERAGGNWFDHFARDTFQDAQLPTIYTIGSGVHTFPDTTIFVQHGGQLATGAVIGNDAQISTKLRFAIQNEDVRQMKVKIKLRLADFVAFEFFVGFVAAGMLPLLTLPSLSPANSFAGLQIDNSVDDRFRTQTSNGGGIQSLDSGISFDNAENEYTVLSDPDFVDFFLDGVSLGRNNANLPISQDGYSLVIFLQTEAAVAKTLNYDKMEVLYL